MGSNWPRATCLKTRGDWKVGGTHAPQGTRIPCQGTPNATAAPSHTFPTYRTGAPQQPPNLTHKKQMRPNGRTPGHGQVLLPVTVCVVFTVLYLLLARQRSPPIEDDTPMLLRLDGPSGLAALLRAGAAAPPAMPQQPVTASASGSGWSPLTLVLISDTHGLQAEGQVKVPPGRCNAQRPPAQRAAPLSGWCMKRPCLIMIIS